MKTRAFLLLHLAVLLAGGTGILGRLISLGGLGLVWYRMLVAVVTMLLTLLCLRRKFAVSRRNGLRIAACGMLLTLHWVAFFASIKASNVSAGVACIATSCFFTSLFDPLLNRHKVSWRDVLISFIAIAGILLVFSLDVRYRMGITLGILSAALYSLFSVCNVRTAQATGTDSSTMLIWELIGGAALLTLIVPLYVLLSHTPLPVPAPGDMLPIVLLGSLFTVVPIFLQVHVLRTLSAFTVNITYNLEPIYSIILAAIIFNEAREVGLSFWIGIVFIVISIILQTIRTIHKSPIHHQRKKGSFRIAALTHQIPIV